jgi:hypothetical protein
MIDRKTIISAIELVNSYRVVLSDEEFIDAMENALRLRSSKNGVKLEKAIFGSKSADVESRRSWHLLEREVMATDTVARFYRNWFADAMRGHFENSQAARKAWGLVVNGEL